MAAYAFFFFFLIGQDFQKVTDSTLFHCSLPGMFEDTGWAETQNLPHSSSAFPLSQGIFHLHSVWFWMIPGIICYKIEIAPVSLKQCKTQIGSNIQEWFR